MTYLMLEDRRERTPEVIANYIYPVELRAMYRKEQWQIVRSYDEFVEWILKYGLPDVISFDHDLADEHYAFAGNYNVFRYETGYDAAKWLCKYCKDNNKPLPQCYVHSMNPVGADNIRHYLENFKKETMRKNIEMKSHGLKCDNPKCDWKSEDIKVEDAEKYLNTPCPKCGENILTEEDFKNLQAVIKTADFINSLSPEEIDEFAKITGFPITTEGKGGGLFSMSVETHKEIKISEIKKVEDEDTGDRSSTPGTGTGTTI